MSERQIRRVREIPEGNAGVVISLDLMRALARTPDPAVDEAAAGLLAQTWPVVTPYILAALVHQFLLDHLVYTLDAEDVEEVRSPEWMLSQIEHYGTAQGDCDDYVTLGAALALALGLRPRFRVVSQRESGEYDHVYLQIEVSDGSWITSDAIHGQPFGWEVDPRLVTARLDVPV
jgi:transglutaminase-like putative cysteine protease